MFGRNLPISRLLTAGRTFIGILPRLGIVKRPLEFLWYYLRQKSPEYIDLRSGHRFYFSSHPHDLVSFCIVFLKREYGKVDKGDVVFDVGANIGSFAVYAALSGARKVYSFEPSVEAFEILSRNIRANRLEEIIIPFNKAVSDQSGEMVRFPYNSSPFNSLAITAGPESNMHVERFSGDLREHVVAMAAIPECRFAEIATITLEDAMDEQGIPFIDLLKMDCEGAEFSIIPALTGAMIDRIRKIRMECHGDPIALLDSFRKDAFMVERLNGEDIWLVRRPELSASDVNRVSGKKSVLWRILSMGKNSLSREMSRSRS